MRPYSNNSSRSRIRRRLENQGKRQAILFTLGILLVVFLILKFGIVVVTKIGDVFIPKAAPQSGAQTTESKNVIFPPILDPLPNATNSATLTISGRTTEQNVTVQLFINNEVKDESKPDNKGNFVFKDITLSQGLNIIQTRSKSKTTTSTFSNEDDVTFAKGQPKLDVTSPQDNATFSKDSQDVAIQGTTDPNNRVTVNGFWAIVDSNGNFTYTLSLSGGDNTVTVIAQDPAGNTTKKELHLTYQQ